MDYEPERSSFCLPALWHYGAAVRRERMDDPYGRTGAQAGAAYPMGNAERGTGRGLCILLPLAYLYGGLGDLLAWDTGLR